MTGKFFIKLTDERTQSDWYIHADHITTIKPYEDEEYPNAHTFVSVDNGDYLLSANTIEQWSAVIKRMNVDKLDYVR